MKEKPKRKTVKEKHGLFSKATLEYIERIRRGIYDKEPYFPPPLPFSIVNSVSVWQGVGERENPERGFKVANEYIKKFTEDGNFDHILFVFRHLSFRAFWCPVILNIVAELRSQYRHALWTGDIQLKGELEKTLNKVGVALLSYTTKYIRQTKIPLMYRRLQCPTNKRRGWLSSEQNKTMYIKDIYEKYKKECKKNRKTDKSLIQKMSLDRDFYKSEISKLNNELEKRAHKEAKKKTVNFLAKETGIKLGSKYLDEILAIANDEIVPIANYRFSDAKN